ncbi:FecR domain-containing protein [Nodosilinea sp. LEGE 07088]|uniref:FecR domain-containing protein n=1 Tax=Nodosilinea sp. LEGE 07088 TaxID=2777968 RepID=UPI001882ECE8|nr:FecR domain-containing protein [Nodosilinea sp. LEGE 07088]MBE9140857.1 FecR domain-containing protein [Nodosilinea sp. LEGE 07088]
MVSGIAIAAPAVAGVPLAPATVRTSTNQVNLVSTQGARPAALAECFGPGDTLSTAALANAEVLFNDGSLARLGEQANLRFWPQTRKLHLSQGTAVLFVPPGQGRTTIQTPNATVGLNSSGVVVRHVPSRNLTLVMALANSTTGPVSITTGAPGQEFALYAGQMTLINGVTSQIVEFDLLEFYQTSNLIANLDLANPDYQPAADEPLAALRPDLLAALAQQLPFSTNDGILDPNLINDVMTEVDLQSAEPNLGVLPTPIEELRRDNDAPPGVVTPLPTNPSTPTEPVESLSGG